MPRLTQKQALDGINKVSSGAKWVGRWGMGHMLASLAIIALLVIAYLVFWKIPRIERSVRSAQFSADSIAAVSDTTRQLQLKMLSDSMAAFERRAVQTEMVADAFDKAMKKVSAAVAGITVRVDAASGQATGDVVRGPNDVRRAEFHVEKAPFIADAKVVLPPPPSKGTIDVAFALAPFDIGVRIQCGNPVLGIRPATVALTTPDWMKPTVNAPTLERRVCNPEKKTGVSKWWVPVGFGVGIYLGSRFGGE